MGNLCSGAPSNESVRKEAERKKGASKSPPPIPAPAPAPGVLLAVWNVRYGVGWLRLAGFNVV